MVDQRLRRMASVVNHIRAMEIFRQSCGWIATIRLSSRQVQTQGITQATHDEVNLKAEPAATAAQFLSLLLSSTTCACRARMRA